MILIPQSKYAISLVPSRPVSWHVHVASVPDPESSPAALRRAGSRSILYLLRNALAACFLLISCTGVDETSTHTLENGGGERVAESLKGPIMLEEQP